MKSGKILMLLGLGFSTPLWAAASINYGLHYGNDLYDDNRGGSLQAMVFGVNYDPQPQHRFKLSGTYNHLKLPNAHATQRGWGDTLLGYQYRLLPTSGRVLDFEGKVKLPTASEADGLGTGEADYTLAAALSQKLGQHWLQGKLGYKWRGGQGLKDGYQLQLSDSYLVTPKLTLGGSLNYVEPSRDDVAARQELMLNVSYKLTRDTGVTLYGNKGFSAASPGLSGGVMLSHSFRD